MIGSFYRPGRSPLHRFDPRCKLLLVLLFTVLFFLPVRLALYAGYLLFVSLWIVSTLGMRELLRPLRTIAPILVLVLILTPPFRREGRILLRLFGAPLVSTEGILETVRLLLRFTGITLAFFSALRTLDIETLILTLRWFGLPFAASLSIGIAFQYIPTIKDIYAQVQDAHRLRAASGGAAPPKAKPGVRSRLRRLLPVLTSVLILSIRRIPSLASALEVRGVGRRNPRTCFRALPGGFPLARDALISAAVAGASIAAAVLFP